jgi:hypothetical protein
LFRLSLVRAGTDPSRGIVSPYFIMVPGNSSDAVPSLSTLHGSPSSSDTPPPATTMTQISLAPPPHTTVSNRYRWDSVWFSVSQPPLSWSSGWHTDFERSVRGGGFGAYSAMFGGWCYRCWGLCSAGEGGNGRSVVMAELAGTSKR